MTSMFSKSKMWPVLFAAAVIVVLAGSLGARLVTRDSSAVVLSASSATIPTGAPPLTYNVSFFSRMFPWTPKLSFGSPRSSVYACRQRNLPVARSTAATTAPSAAVLPAAV